MTSLVLRTATRLLVGLILVFAVYLLWRGHHSPGGGFSAALVASTGFALYALAEGPMAVRRSIVVQPQYFITCGLCVGLISGLPAIFKGLPFLTGLWWPQGRTAVVGTPLLFDLGVFAVVLGAILTLLLALEEQ